MSLSPTATTARRLREPHTAQLGAIVGGLALALVPVGYLSVSDAAIVIPVAVSALVIPLVLFDSVVGALRDRATLEVRRYLTGPTVGSLLMGLPILATPSRRGQVLSFSLFVLGTMGGALIGLAWGRSERRWSPVEVGLTVFVAVTLGQLALIGLENPDLSGFHRAAVLPWGGSNYVAGALVVASMTLIARGADRRPLQRILGFAGILAALLTLSRGALIAAGVGTLVLLWNSGSSRSSRFLLRTMAVLTPLIGLRVLSAVTAQRSIGGYDPSSNVDARYTLFARAWEQFVDHPLTGTGWLALRALPDFNPPISYAHNLVLSFLQIGGLIGLSFLGVLTVAVVRCWRRSPALRPAVCAALAISMSDPFLEGYVGALLTWAVLIMGASVARPKARTPERSR